MRPVALLMLLVALTLGCRGHSSEREDEAHAPEPQTTQVPRKPPPTWGPPPPPDEACADDYDCPDCWEVSDDECGVLCSSGAMVRTFYERLPERYVDGGGTISDVSCHLEEGHDCDEQPGCRAAGFCSAGSAPGTCVMKEGDCEKTKLCAWFGQCEESSFGCVVATDRHCLESRMCAREGKCVTDGEQCVEPGAAPKCEPPRIRIDGVCRFPADYDCSGPCEKEGLCEPFVATLDEHGRTTSLPFAVCVEGDAGCRDTEGCRELGLCEGRDQMVMDYEPDPDHPFTPSTEVVFGGCTASDAGCAESDVCEEIGRCGGVPGQWGCHPTAPEDCLASTHCKKFGRCVLRDGVCVAREEPK